MPWQAVMADTVDTVIIGGGVVGLACARALAQAGEEVWLLEAASALGQGISSRSSEVIHAGLYYPEDSLKAALCCRGRELLYEFCAARGVGHRKLGKLIGVSSDRMSNIVVMSCETCGMFVSYKSRSKT